MMTKEQIIESDLVIIGAGLYGIQVARTTLEVHPEESVVILEASGSAGGVWNFERMYDAFWTQTPVDMAGFSDDPISSSNVPESDQYYGFFAAKHVAKYLESYTAQHVYSGTSLHSRIQFDSKVVSVEKKQGKWTIKNANGAIYRARRVVDATGLTSQPIIPSLPGFSKFKGQTLHHLQFGRSSILSESSIEHVVVLGGAKSAADVAYAAAKAGKKVSWIIRKSGSGPAAFFGVQGSPGYRNSFESFYNPFMSYFLASAFVTYPWWIRWLYTTEIGTKLFRKFWDGVTASTFAATDYDRDDGKGNGFSNLKPDTPLFWQNDSSSVANRSDLLDIIARNVHVYRDDITLVSEDSLQLSSGTTIDAIDALIFATGWENTHAYMSPALSAHLGVPFSASAASPAVQQDLAFWNTLEAESSAKLLDEFWILRSRPTHHTSASDGKVERQTPYRLHRCICPLTDTSILFPGHVMLGNAFRNAEAQALWIVALWDGVITSPVASAVAREGVARIVAWDRLRYLEKGTMANWFYFDILTYTGSLLDEVGLRSHKAKRGKGLFEPGWAKDLSGCIEEYKLRKRRGIKKSMKGNGLTWTETFQGIRGLISWTWALLPL